MRLYLDVLKKSESASPQPKRGEMKGGKYAARAEIGQNKDGSPRYKYFATREEYKEFLARQSGDDESKTEEHRGEKTNKDTSPFPRITIAAKDDDSKGDKPEKDEPKKKTQPLLVARKSLNIQYFYDLTDEL